MLGVALGELDLQPFGGRPGPGPLQQGVDVVDAVTSQPQRAAARAALPLPVATSSTRSPARRPAFWARPSAMGTIRAATAA